MKAALSEQNPNCFSRLSCEISLEHIDEVCLFRAMISPKEIAL